MGAMADLLRIPTSPQAPVPVVPPPATPMATVAPTPIVAPPAEFRVPFLSNLADIPRLYREEKAGAVQDLATEGVLPKMSGVLRGLFSPVTAVFDSFVGKPVERATGSETAGEVARIGAELLTPGIGLTKVPAALRALAAGRAVGAPVPLAALPKPNIGPVVPEVGVPAEAVVPKVAEAVPPASVLVRTSGVDVPEQIGSFSREGHLYRGMTEAEFNATLGKNQGVQSRGDYSFSKEGTSFGDKAEDAESYVNFGRDDPRKTGKPNYLVEVERNDDIFKRDTDGYMKAKDAVPAGQIRRVWKMEGTPDGHVAARLIKGADVPRVTIPAGAWSQDEAKQVVGGLGGNFDVVGSVSTKGSSKNDLDVLAKSAYQLDDLNPKLSDMGFEFEGQSLLSPKEAKAGGKQFVQDKWSEIHHYKNPSTGKKVEVWRVLEEGDQGIGLGARPPRAEPELLPPKEGSPIPGEPVKPTKPLPVNPESLALPGEIGLAYHTALNPEVFKRAGKAGLDYFKANPGKYNRSLSVTENIGSQIGKQGGIDAKWLKEFGLGDDEFKTVSTAYESMRQSAQSMGSMARVSRELNLRIKGLPPEQREALGLAAQDIDDAAEMLPWWRRVDNIGRGAMVSQLGTAVRNAETVVARLGMDTMTSALDNGIARVLGKTPKVGALDGFETFMNTIGAIRPKNYKGQKNLVSEMMTAFPSATGRLLARYNSDLRVGGEAGEPAIGIGEKALRGGEKLVDMANVFNRGQEFLIRRAVFQSTLAQEVRKGGTELDDIVKSGEAWKVPEEAVNKAVERSLEVTFGQAAKPGTASADFVNMINKTAPLSTLGVPFPRFLTQSWKFTFEHSPLGFLRYASKDERAKFAAGDMKGLSKAVIGTGLFGAAVAMRHSPNAGARWWEYKRDNGKVVDLRPFAPFSTYLFMADLMDHATGHRQGQMDSKDVMNGLLGVNIRAGTGLSLLDSALEGAVNSAKQGDIPKFLKQLSGEYLARATVPFAQLRDAYDEILDGVSVTRERAPEGREFTGPIIGNLPILSRTLPEVESATQSGPPLTEKPFSLKQLTGIRQTPGKSAGAEELDRLGFRMNEILPKTGEKAVDRKYAARLGPLVEGPLSRLVQSPRYQAMSDEQKGVVLAEQLKGLRGVMRLQAGLTPEEAVRLRVGGIPERTKRLLDKDGRLSEVLRK